jgi:hypothetical protein
MGSRRLGDFPAKERAKPSVASVAAVWVWRLLRPLFSRNTWRPTPISSHLWSYENGQREVTSALFVHVHSHTSQLILSILPTTIGARCTWGTARDLDGGNAEKQKQQSKCGEEQHQGVRESSSKGSYKTKAFANCFRPEIPMPAMSQEFQPHREFDTAPSQPLVLVHSKPLPQISDCQPRLQ